ncbi:uncharacterized protein LOC133180743 isoform X2 [Saccostrea echinata]|uniref:uncharacterized protein LOC133180743 isoform X2 n=1 Tax=Saccostrea echinata TaxID=191078 RepID=UPI002A83D66B|nr:uncharacterized protein LOC133180743 isoform X2 [Saccostrea echinata]
MKNFEYLICKWRNFNILTISVILDDINLAADVSNSSLLYRYNKRCMERSTSKFYKTDKQSDLQHTLFVPKKYSGIAIGKRLPRKQNIKERDFLFSVFFSKNSTTFASYDKMVFENRTRTRNCTTIRPNFNYSGVSLKENASLSSNSTSSIFMFDGKSEDYFIHILMNVLFILLLKCKYKRLTFTSSLDDAKVDHHLQSFCQSTKSSSQCVTGTLEEFDNISIGYLDHTVHVKILVEVVFEAIILGYFWRLHFITCFSNTLKRSRVGLKLLSKHNFKIQIMSLTMHIHIQYNSPTNAKSELPVQKSNLSNIIQDCREAYDDVCKERNTCHSDDNISDDSLFSTFYPSLSLSETEEGNEGDCSLKLETAYCVDAQTMKYVKDLSRKISDNVNMSKNNILYDYDNCKIPKNNTEFSSVMSSENCDTEHTFVKHKQNLTNEDREDNETSLKTIGSDSSVDEYSDSSLSGNINDLNDLNISPRDGSKIEASVNNKALSFGKPCSKEMKRTIDCVLNSTEMSNTKKVCEIGHMYKSECPYFDFGDCGSSLDTLSFYDSNKMESKGNDSVVLSSLRSLPTSSGFENIECYHCCSDIKQNNYEQLNTPVEETFAFSTAINIVTSSSKYKELHWSPNTTSSNRTYIAQGVRKFLKKYRSRQRRRLLRRITQCTSRVENIKTDKIICNPLFTKDTYSNTTDQREASQPEPEIAPVRYPQNHTAGIQTDVYQLLDYESSLGTLSSIFNDISIQSLNENDGYQYEWIRLASFTNFSSETVHATRLARSGWYSTGNGDQTTCFSCHRVHENWTRSDDPNGNTLHDPDCSFMLRISNNRPIPRESTVHRDLSSESLVTQNSTQEYTQRTNQQINSGNSGNTTILPSNLSSQISLPFENGLNGNSSERPSFIQRPVAEATSSERTRETQLEALMRDPMGINFDRPKYPSYAILAVRISSFTDWPAAMTQTPRDMALAGFFFAGYGDYTRCFFCGGGLRNWEAGDDPWVEHARWFSKCAFVRQNRGQQFIDLVLRRAAEIEQQQTENQCEEATENKKAKEAKIMNSAAVRSIKDMGYGEDKIKEAIDTIKSRLPKGKHKVSAHEILEVLFELADTSSIRVTQHSEPTVQHTEPTVRSQSFEHQSSTNLMANTSEEGATSAVNNLTLNDLESLQRENTSLKDQIICKICMEKNVSIAFLPCGHLACCADCAPAMRKCPICREFVRGTVKTYLV